VGASLSRVERWDRARRSQEIRGQLADRVSQSAGEARSGQIKLRRIDGWRNIATVLSQHTAVAA